MIEEEVDGVSEVVVLMRWVMWLNAPTSSTTIFPPSPACSSSNDGVLLISYLQQILLLLLLQLYLVAIEIMKNEFGIQLVEMELVLFLLS